MYSRIVRIIAIGGLGDVLLSTPSFKALKQRDKRSKIIIHCTSRSAMEIFINNPYIDRVKSTSFFANMIPYILFHLKKLRFGSIAYGQLLPSVGYNKNATEIIAEMLGVELEDKKVQVFLNRAEEHKALQLLSGYRNPIALHISSLTSKNQEWPLQNWEELVRQMPDYTFLQLGLAADDKVAGTVDLRSETSFREALAIIKYVNGFAGVCSAFSHATNAFGTPGVVLFGASTPTIWGHANNINLYKALPCAPCIDLILNHTCPYGKPCMKLITVEEVRTALLKQIGIKEKQPVIT
jgi:ADP-heptose:LPS heptosyltransferase